MRKAMTEETKAKILASKQERRDNRAATLLEFGEYRVTVFDEWNWCVQKGDDEGSRAYFPDLGYCLRHVLHKEIGKRVAQKAGDLLTAIKDAENAVLSAAPFHNDE
jgi:hypothetical protein